MKKIFILYITLLSFFIFSGCSHKAVKPVVNAYTLDDFSYPCMRIDFSDQVRYINMKKVKDGDNIALVYNLAMPGYEIDVIKMYALEGSYSLESLPSLYDNPSKLFEITSIENPDKSAVIFLDDRKTTGLFKRAFKKKSKDGIYLKGSVGYFIQSDRIVRVDIKRIIKKSGTFKHAGLEEWVSSTIGKRTIENMKNIVNSVYSSISTTMCPNKRDLNSNWWE